MTTRSSRRRFKCLQDERFVRSVLRRDLVTLEDAIAQGANVNVSFTHSNLTEEPIKAVDIASISENQGMMRILLQAGADINNLGPDGLTPLQRCTIRDNVPMARLLLTQNDIVPDKYGPDMSKTPLQIAVFRNRLDMAHVLITHHGSDVNVRDEDGDTLGHLARTPQMIACLHQQGVDLCQGAGAKNITPLHRACRDGHMNIVQTLVSQVGVPVDHLSGTRYTSLHYAAMRGQFAVLRWLVEHGGADIRLNDRGGHTCFHIACFFKHRQIVMWLLEQEYFTGKERTPSGESAMTRACSKCGSTDATPDDSLTIVRELLQRSDRPSIKDYIVMLFNAAQWSTPICRLLVEEHAFDAVRVPSCYVNVMFYAVKKGKTDTVTYFVSVMKSLGWNLDLPDRDNGKTALHLAVAYRCAEKVAIFLDAGCSVHAVDNEGRTPLDVYQENEEEDLKILRLLLDRGADPTRVDRRGGTPFFNPRATQNEVFLMGRAAAALGFFRFHTDRAAPLSGRKRLSRRAKTMANKRMRLCR